MFMTQETPGKVMALLGASLFSMLFLFGVSATNASFSQTETTLPDVFNPAPVMAVLDSVSNSYSNFAAENLIQPAQQSYAIGQYNLAYIMDEAGPTILAISGFDSLVNQEPTPQVAGAYTQSNEPHAASTGFNIDTLYSLLIE